MYIGLTPELQALRDELRDYYAQLLTPEVEDELSHSEGVGPVARRIWKQMASDGWAGIGWPPEYGGQGRSQIEQFIFFDESMRAGAPVPMLTINSVAPTIMRYGSQAQKDFFLPKILEGEIHFAIGYTEPDSGTDLASLRTRAERDGDEYVINGQKIFTSLATDADYIWLAVRTDPTMPVPCWSSVMRTSEVMMSITRVMRRRRSCRYTAMRNRRPAGRGQSWAPVLRTCWRTSKFSRH